MRVLNLLMDIMTLNDIKQMKIAHMERSNHRANRKMIFKDLVA